MSKTVEPLIDELEEVTAQMLATTCWDQKGEFGELLASRGALSARLMDRQGLDAGAARRIWAVIQDGNDLLARLIAMRQFALDAMVETEAQRRFAHELGSTLPDQTQHHQLDLKA